MQVLCAQVNDPNQKAPGHSSLGELFWLAAICICFHTLLLKKLCLILLHWEGASERQIPSSGLCPMCLSLLLLLLLVYFTVMNYNLSISTSESFESVNHRASGWHCGPLTLLYPANSFIENKIAVVRVLKWNTQDIYCINRILKPFKRLKTKTNKL